MQRTSRQKDNLPSFRTLLGEVRDAGEHLLWQKEEWLLALAKAHKSSAIRRSAIVALRKLQADTLWPALISILTIEHNENLREIAIKALADIRYTSPQQIQQTLHILQTLMASETLSRFGRQAAGIHLSRDSCVSVMYPEGLNSAKSSGTHQRTDRHHGIVGQKRSYFQCDS